MNITTISGIVSCYILEYNGKMYYLFGDQHFSRAGNCKELGYACDHFDKTFTKTYTYGRECTTIGALLHNWFIYNNKHNILTDFYIELFYTKENERQSHKIYNDIIAERKNTNINTNVNTNLFKDHSWLQVMYYIMKPCFVREKKQCPYYPNVHVHYTDVRDVEINDKIIPVNPFDIDEYQYVEYVKLLFLQCKVILGYLFDVNGFELFLRNIHHVPEEIQKTLINNVSLFTTTKVIDGKEITMYKTAWELYRLEQVYPMIAQELRYYSMKEADTIIKRMYNIIKHKKITFDEYNALFLDIQSLSMDVYTLSRVFIQEDSEEIIIYAGAYHIRFYADFLQHIGFTLLDSVPYKKGQNCIIMDKLPMYLNANKYRS